MTAGHHDQPVPTDRAGRDDRQLCYEAICACDVPRAEAAFDPICAAWLRCTRAAMAGLWLYNRFSKTFELNGLATELDGPTLSKAPSLTPGSAFHYVLETMAPQYVDDVRTWSRELGERRFHVETRPWLDERGLQCAVYVPILKPVDGHRANRAGEEGDEGSDVPVDGVMSLHFRDRDASLWCHPRADSSDLDEATARSLLLMGRMSGMLIAKLRLRQQAKVGDMLATIAGRHLTRVQDDPRIVRREYVLEVLKDVLRGELGIQAASLWLRVPFAESLVCIATLGGLQRVADGRVLYTSTDIADAEYRPDDADGSENAWTYEAFRTGAFRLWRPDHDPAHSPKFRDLVDAKPAERLSPVLLMPIVAAPNAPRMSESAQAGLGVVRCGHLPAPKFGAEARRTFDVVEVRILEFVCRQLSPVLHTLENRIMREDAISVIKHDTAASLGAIRDLIDEIEQRIPRGNEGLDYSLRNIRENVMSAASLADRLARDVEHQIRVDPAKTDIGREIMPRVKRLLTPYAADEKGMEIRFVDFEQLPPLNVDPRLVERALYNLLVNAIKYGRRATTIRIKAASDAAGHHIDVVNEGEGVHDEDLPRLFRMYFRSRYARGEGSGLGLAIVRQIMRNHQGDVTLVSPRNPTVFRLTFPLSRAAGPRGT